MAKRSASTSNDQGIRGGRGTAASRRGKEGRVRYAVVALGHISQVAVLPAFDHAKKNSELTALVSSDPKKLRALGKRHGVDRLCSYDELDALLAGDEVDAVYLSLPNHMHKEFTLRAARHGKHVLCEKPMAVTAQECQQMIEACRQARVKLMVAYRLHFEPANLNAMKIAHSGRLGELKVFSSTFTMQVRGDNIRLEREKGGGTLYDIGIYCINAARMMFRAEPIEALAQTVSGREERFSEVEQSASVVLRYPGDRLASFVCSFGADDVESYTIVGTKGSITVDPAYSYSDGLAFEIKQADKRSEKTFRQTDQFAAELLYFSECIQSGKEPEPSGLEGQNDVRIIEACYRSARTGRPVPLDLRADPLPTPAQETKRPPVKKAPKEVNAASPRDS